LAAAACHLPRSSRRVLLVTEGDGPVVRTLVEYIDEQRPRLVVMGTRGLTGLSAFRRR
jgi:nucleotide-binding universal stress UspA family protein